ncbi:MULTISPECIES: hypothetical protein [Nocardioides]|uniref:DUF732 domain-containing protein n=1 Tax=Nocardioides vastitatis TaxID=2568655 RepID=A0ABW0ZDZ3_9ACTN|nr:hypothetical protein [Nocardioides sp.]THI97816.1 hypothetical protein E7Z54_14390 [Nocardioides sp.]
MSSARRIAAGTSARVGLAVLLGGVLAVVLFLRPGDDPAPPPTSPRSAAPSGVMPSATPSIPPSPKEFCDAYRTMAGAQSQYVVTPDARAAELLRERADQLLAVGTPASMPLTARGGFFVELSGVYASIGLALAPEAIPGAAELAEVQGASAAFGSFLAGSCPPF